MSYIQYCPPGVYFDSCQLMSKRLWRDSQGKIWIVTEEEVVSAEGAIPLLPDIPEPELHFELPMRVKFTVSMSKRRTPELIPEEELETIVQENYYGPRST